ncbi:helix-turn-helix transcriptional regulator [Virgisporangium ochraceum]|uniref:Transcriptional regulator n=2 Tax=Virgisporangium ochraceum TaxID=65505 RepID=A0A8J4EEA2_9ACTN|nr:transcriptional regulator [Virgisporangium ochraceum]
MTGTTDLGRALHAWRDRTRPAEAGLPDSGHRRAPGLRREELALLAGLSVDYIVRLEQGRSTHPSPQVLSALARALRLSAAEREHLFVLAGHAAPGPGQVPGHVPAGVQRLLDRLTGTPLSVYDAAWNLITWNPLWAALFGNPPASRGFARNAVWWAFVEPPTGYPQAVSRETRHRAAFVSDLRAASARYPKDTGLAALIAELHTRSGDFAALWDSVMMAVHVPQTKTVRHASVGELTLDCDILAALGTDLRIMAFTVAEGSETAERLRLLEVVGVQTLTGPETDT